jgi:integrase
LQQAKDQDVPSETRKPVALTHRFLEAINPAENPFRVPDVRCAGLAIRVAPSGVVTFDLAYRIAKTKKFRRISLGKFPSVSLEAARNRANELTRAARAGRDLLGDEHQKRLAAENRVSVGTLIDEYVARRVKGRLRSAVEIEARLKRALRSIFDRPADEIQRRDLRRLLDATADAGHLREAEQRRITLNGLFRWAVAQDYIENNPTIGLTSFGRSPPRQRVLSGEEIRKLWAWLEAGTMPPAPADILRLQLCLGARCTEIGGMRVEEFDTDNWIWELPAERSKNKKSRLTPIIGLARDILKARIAEARAGCLFVTDTGRWLTSAHVGHFVLNHPVPIATFGTHDLRRTVATQMVEGLALPLDVVARVIGHQAGGAATRTLVAHYVSAEFIEQKTAALLKWDARLRSIIAGETPASNVLPFVDGPRRSISSGE